MDLATPLAGYLARTGRSKYSLAKATGLPWKTIHRVATGRHSPGKRVAQAIADATGGEVSAEELIVGSSTSPSPEPDSAAVNTCTEVSQ